MTRTVDDRELPPAKRDMEGCAGVFRPRGHKVLAGARPARIAGRLAYWAACNVLAWPAAEASTARVLPPCSDCARAHPARSVARQPAPPATGHVSGGIRIVSGCLD